jgi:micrococcal nuclease
MEHTIPENVSYEDCKVYYPKIMTARVIKIYDADTITVACICAGQEGIYRISIRLMGIDAPEMRDGNPDIKIRAYAARDALRDRIMGKIVHVEVAHIKEKYGRILADVFLGEEHINEWLITNGHAVRYNGGKKESF